MVVEMVSSALSMTIITGCLAVSASSAQMGSSAALEVTPLPLPPKPPPMSVEMTRTLLSGSPVRAATSVRTGNGAWALAHTVMRPSSSGRAAAMRGSRYWGWIILVS